MNCNFDETANEHNVYINNTEITFVQQIKCLGDLIDNKLLFHDHVNFLCKKIFPIALRR